MKIKDVVTVKKEENQEISAFIRNSLWVLSEFAINQHSNEVNPASNEEIKLKNVKKLEKIE